MQQCQAILKNGLRCKRRQDSGYCYEHATKKASPSPKPKNKPLPKPKPANKPLPKPNTEKKPSPKPAKKPLPKPNTEKKPSPKPANKPLPKPNAEKKPSPKPPKTQDHTLKYSFDTKPTNQSIRKLHDFLRALPWEEYQVCWTRPNHFIEAKPIRGLEKCSSPDRRTFLNKVEERQGTVGHFRSATGMSRLVIPLKPYTHMACFVKEASAEEFRDMVSTIHNLVKQSTLPNIRVFTHGLDVDWLHVKIRPDPLE
jgi:hypothetical protein